ncbi:hypothetical protein M0802_009082 [Mischocyttarus mexicanus]|nr:hypothetical protein M0802_009082 [Mischocyttarus mexicanus]
MCETTGKQGVAVTAAAAVIANKQKYKGSRRARKQLSGTHQQALTACGVNSPSVDLELPSKPLAGGPSL